MQTPDDFAIWLRCIYLWVAVHCAAYRHRYQAWRLARRAVADRKRQIETLELWSAAPAVTAARAYSRLIWDIDQADAAPYLCTFAARSDDRHRRR